MPWLLYGSPPGDVATILAFGREYQVGTHLGPPAAFWLADIAFRLSGNHIFGVYLLSQLCFIVTFWALFQLSRAIVGAQQAILAVLLTATITAFSFPGVEFGPLDSGKAAVGAGAASFLADHRAGTAQRVVRAVD